MTKVFIICPVRNVSEKIRENIRQYVLKLEESGKKVHWPFRDTNQKDHNGIEICKENREGIFIADEIHIWFDSESMGSLFDIGMVFAFLKYLDKKIVLINKREISSTPSKSFQNVVLKLAEASR